MSVVGTKIKPIISVDPIGGIHLSECDFKCKFYNSRGRTVYLDKEELLKKSDDSYVARLDSNDFGPGSIMVTVTIQVPDPDFDDGLRTEVVSLWTGATIDPELK